MLMTIGKNRQPLVLKISDTLSKASVKAPCFFVKIYYDTYILLMCKRRLISLPVYIPKGGLKEGNMINNLLSAVNNGTMTKKEAFDMIDAQHQSKMAQLKAEAEKDKQDLEDLKKIKDPITRLNAMMALLKEQSNRKLEDMKK